MCRLRRDETKEGTDSDPQNRGRTGKKNGRGAYLCPQKACFEQAVKNRGLERSFKQAIPQEVYERLEKEMDEIG